METTVKQLPIQPQLQERQSNFQNNFNVTSETAVFAIKEDFRYLKPRNISSLWITAKN